MYDRLYIAFLHGFNIARDYYECHDYMEELWLEEGRNPAYQGLLQVAVSLYHFGNGNLSGAVKLMTAALEKLEGQPEEWQGIQVGKLVRDSRVYLKQLQNYDEEPFEFYTLDIVITDPELEGLVERYEPEEEEEGEDRG